MKTVKYIVIANFPSCLHGIGDLITVYESSPMAYVSEGEWSDLKDYPHLFELVTD